LRGFLVERTFSGGLRISEQDQSKVVGVSFLRVPFLERERRRAALLLSLKPAIMVWHISGQSYLGSP
jgi:hypothetical protein